MQCNQLSRKMQQYMSKTDLERLHLKKWKEYKNLKENGDEYSKLFAQHAMLTIKSLESDIKDHFSKKKVS
jgi:hypothetical protein